MMAESLFLTLLVRQTATMGRRKKLVWMIVQSQTREHEPRKYAGAMKRLIRLRSFEVKKLADFCTWLQDWDDPHISICYE